MITVEEFQSFFKRDFPYLPIYDASKTYLLEDQVYEEESGKFYMSLQDDNDKPLTDTDYWQRVSDDIYNYVLIEDIEKAIDQSVAIAPKQHELGMSNEIYLLVQLYLAAHILVDVIRTSNQGLASQINAITTGKSVGSVSQQFGIPDNLLQNELFAYYITTQYGLRYLMLLLPYLRGNISVVRGATTP
mgnify:CR=1 FL=1